MRFTDTFLAGVVVIDPEPAADERGAFTRTFCTEEFAARGLNSAVAQCSTSLNHRRGTLRGLHYQLAPHAECKLVRCTRGSIYDVAVDLRPDSPTYRRWLSVELSGENGRMLYIPEGLAHGFQTLEDDSEVAYQMSRGFSPEHYRGVRFDDPAFGVNWPFPVSVISERDLGYPTFETAVAA
jgi:dTDP-4-dehydrorhamnose 3,5-epimerase